MLFYASDRIEYRNSIVFQKLIDELNFLQREGILIDTECGPQRIYFALGVIAGDNLGLNSILGFVEGFTAMYYCRLCKTDKFTARLDFDEKNLRLENNEHCEINLDPQSTGIKEKSVWDNVDYFDTSANFYSDWLHEGPEGQAHHDMCLILHYFVTNKCFTLHVLNSRLKSFHSGDNRITNPPPLITEDELKDKKLKMSASEMNNFILIFSMLVGDLVPHDSDVWQLYLILRKIVDLVMSRRIQRQATCILRNLVKQHHTLFNKLFPDQNIKPKGHLWVHYATVLENSGPIINLSTARFESKHKNKKDEAGATTSRKNIVATLCIKEQLVLCHRLLAGKGFTSNSTDGPYVLVDDISHFEKYPLFKSSLPQKFQGPCLSLNWVKINGQTYKPRTVVLLRIEGTCEMLPLFGIVELVLANDSEILLICEKLITHWFNEDLHAFNVEKSNMWECFLVSDLHSPFPCIYSSLGDMKLVAVRHAL